MKKRNRVLAFILAVTMLITCNSGANLFYATETGGQDVSTSITGEDGLMVEGTNSFGSLLANELETELDDQEENNGCNVFSIEMYDTVASVTFETTQYAMLVVGIYDETGTTMLATGELEVMQGETEAYVDIAIETMPEYFLVRAFLIDEESMRPLCTVCESSMYTQEMQEFLSKTTDDFDAEKVLNLDEDKTNNFAVYSDETIIIPESDEYNKVTQCDEENNTYVIENIDSNISDLQLGNLFSYEYEEGSFLIVKVASIDIDGTTATITGEDSSMEEVFDYVKIDGTSYTQDITVDESTCGDSVIYKGDVEIENNANSPQTYKYEEIPSATYVKEFEFVDQKIGSDAKLTGSIGINITTSVKLYVAKDNKYVEVKLDYKAIADLTLSGKTEEVNLPLAYFNVSPVAGVYITFTPSIIVEVSAMVTLNGQLYGTVGFRASNTGNKNLTTTPQFKSELKGEIKIFLGISLKPEIKILTDKIANASLKASIGVEIKGTSKYSTDNKNSKDIQEIHECELCIDGDIVGVARFSYSASILDIDSLTFGDNIEFSVKIADFYFSYKYGDFDFTSCPHYKYKVLFNIVSLDGKSMQNASIKIDGEKITVLTEDGKEEEVEELLADEEGKAVGYLSSGEYKAVVDTLGYLPEKERFEVEDCATSVYVLLDNQNSGSGGGNDEDVEGDLEEDNADIVTDIGEIFDIGYNRTGVITEDGSLYMWGYNLYYEIGNGTRENQIIPVKVMDNVEFVSLGYQHSGAITEDGSLYMWGSNEYGQIGNGTSGGYQTTPVKILDNVESVTLRNKYSGAITKDGSLYMWGCNFNGVIGNGTTENQLFPEKVLDNVVFVALGDYCCGAITEDGSLYMWGYNYYRGVGNGTSGGYQLAPVKILDDVISVSVAYNHSGAITEDGSLYMWGYNNCGQIGNGTSGGYQLTPVKILDNVEFISLGYGHSGAITENGSLYMWGDNCNGQIGNGTKENQLTPMKVLDNVVCVSLPYDYAKYSGAITEDRTLYMWGDGNYGGIGNDEIETLTPAKILENVEFLSLGDGHNGAITEDGSLYMWGWNYYGQIGNGTTEDQFTPIKIMDNVKLPTNTQSKDTPQFMSMNLFTVENNNVDTDGQATFTDLIPNETYNFYIMKDKKSTEPFNSQNLLYIKQAVSDDSGNLTVSYEPTEQIEDADIFVVQMSQTDVSSAQVELKDLEYTGEIQYVNPVVTLNGTVLAEGKDYELLGEYSALEEGEYTVTIHGIGLYTGKIDISYSVYKDGIKGDINNDGKVNLQDLMKCLHYTSGRILLGESELKAGDVNGDGKVTIADVMKMLHYISGRSETL